jgi:DNA-binding CsgD family transcriptional regulator
MVGLGFIRVERVRAAMRLVGEVRELGTCTEPGRRHLLDGLLTLVGCAIGGAVLDTGYALGVKGGISAATLAGFDQRIIDVFDAHQVHGSAINPFHDAVMRRMTTLQGQVFTATHSELVERKVWNGSLWINEYVRPAHVDHFLCSMRVVGQTAGVGCGFMRAARDRPFSAEDREVLHLVHLGVGQFFDPASPRTRLAPRMRDTLDVLLTGATDKEIAAQLRISPHTVRQYVKAILRAYNATNRAQLIARAARDP